MRSIRAVFFDVGNTLAHLDYDFVGDTIARHYGAVDPIDLIRFDCDVRFRIDQELARRVRSGASLGRETVSITSATVWERYFAELLMAVGVPEPWHAAIIDCLRERERDDTLGLWSRVVGDAAPTLGALRRRGYGLGVISNSDGRIRQRLEHLGLAAHFDVIVDSALVGCEKPAPALFHLALERMSIEPSQALYVGDLYSIDILAARHAGLHATLYDPCGCYAQIEPHSIRTMADLPSMLAS